MLDAEYRHLLAPNHTFSLIHLRPYWATPKNVTDTHLYISLALLPFMHSLYHPSSEEHVPNCHDPNLVALLDYAIIYHITWQSA